MKQRESILILSNSAGNFSLYNSKSDFLGVFHKRCYLYSDQHDSDFPGQLTISSHSSEAGKELNTYSIAFPGFQCVVDGHLNFKSKKCELQNKTVD